MALDLPGTFGTDVRPARNDSGRKPWAKDPTEAGANNGTRVDATFVNDMIGLINRLAQVAGISATPGDDDLIAASIVALIGATQPATHNHDSRYYTESEINAAFQAVSAKGQASGYAGLDGSGKIPTAQLPDAILGAVAFQETWNANTNSPPLASDTGTKGHYYLVTTAGTTTLNGISEWAVGDWVIFDGIVWRKVDNTDAVAAVAGLTGSISASDLKTALAITVASITDMSANARSFSQAADYAAMRSTLGLGTAAVKAFGTGANQLVELDASSRLPAVDGSQLTNLPSAAALPPLRGLTLANNGTDATNDIDVAAGACTSDDGTMALTLASLCVKQIDVAFAEYASPGTASGGRASADNTTGAKWFHVFLIGGSGKNTQPFFATSLSPSLPSGFTTKRRVGSVYWNGSTLKAFQQVGDLFIWKAVSSDISASQGTSRSLYTVLAPTGVRSLYWCQANTGDTDTDYCWLASPDFTDTAAAIAANANLGATDAGSRRPVDLWIPTDASSQIAARGSGTINIVVNGKGYRDLERGY